jgi:hypothetical protein
MRASAPADGRAAQARCTRFVLLESTDTAMLGSDSVRNDVKVVPWSNGMIVATSVAFVNVCPKSVDFANTMASVWLLVANRRHVT